MTILQGAAVRNRLSAARIVLLRQSSSFHNSLFALVTFWPVTMFPSTTTYSQSSSSALEKMPPRSCSLPSMDMGTCCSRLQWLSYASLSPVTRLSSTRYLPFDSLTLEMAMGTWHTIAISSSTGRLLRRVDKALPMPQCADYEVSVCVLLPLLVER